MINSNDRCIRVVRLLSSPPLDSDDDPASPFDQPGTPPPTRPYRIPWFQLEHKFQDLVNRTPWHGCGFSRNGECVMGGAGHKGAHEIHIWDRETGRLNKILEGPKDPCADLDVSFPQSPCMRQREHLNLTCVPTRSGTRCGR